MKPVSDRSFQPVGWQDDTLHSRQGRKDGKEKIQMKEVAPVEPAQIPPKPVQKIPVSLYNNKGEVSTSDSSLGQHVDLQG
jgi:hypothetical protein